MTNTKTLFIYDDGTEIKAIAIKPDSSAVWQAAGFGASPDNDYVLLAELTNTRTFTYDRFNWSNRTMFVAHSVLIDYWDTFKDGDSLDVRRYFDAYLPATRKELP